MGISKITGSNAAKIYAETNAKINKNKDEKQGGDSKAVKTGAAFEKGGVNISRAAKNMNVLEFAKERIKADMNSDAPADKINRLKLAVQSGEYKISAGAVASAVIIGAPQL